MRKRDTPALAWLLQRAQWVGVVCPSLIRLYAQSSLRKYDFIENGCQMLNFEQIPCLTDYAWYKSIDTDERTVFEIEMDQQKSIHAILHEQLDSKRRSINDVSLNINLPTKLISWYVKQMRLRIRTVKPELVHGTIPFDLPKHPSHEEITAFIEKYGKGTPETIRYLSNNNLRLLPGIATRFRIDDCPGLDHEDLVQEGYLALLAAGRDYDPKRSAFSSWATRKVWQRMRYVVRKWRRHSHESVDEKKVYRDELINLFGYSWDILDILGKPGDPQFDDALVLALLIAEDKLDERERDIIRSRYPLDGSPRVKLEKLGKKYGITRSRVNQIEVNALEKIMKRFAESGIHCRHIFG